MTTLARSVLVRLDLGLSSLLGDRPSVPASPGRAVGLLAALTAGLLLGASGLLTVGVVAGVLHAARRRRRTEAERRLLGEVNDLVPLLQLAVGAGLTVRAALAAVRPWSGPRLGSYLSAVLERVERGSSLADELDDLPQRLGPGVRGLAGVLVAGERYGAPLVEPLVRLGSELRAERRRQIERAARTVPVRLLFPLTLGVLPAFVLLAIVPLAAGALDGVALPGSGLRPGP